MTDLIEKARRLPTTPGCYVFKNAAGEEVYVGKAKNLRRRVSSYFQRKEAHPARTLRLVMEAVDFDFYDTDSEVEALLLENQLIKELQPQFNIRLKDDKNYPLLVITKEPFPRVFITRDRDLKGVDYYGPFGSATELRRAYHFLMRVFQFRVCELDIREDDSKRTYFKPCLNYHIKRCSGPCTTRINAESYNADMKALRAFLSGRKKGSVIKDLRERMMAASEAMKYEEAARFRDQLKALDRLRERGRLRDYDAPAAPVVRGDEAQELLQSVLGLSQLPRVIEGFDIAHLQGTDVVASMVQFVDGVPNKDGYRRFRVKGTDGIVGNDDFKAMYEIVGRRYRRLHDEGLSFPDIILIDGGLGQVHMAQKALLELGVSDTCLIGLAKREETIVWPDGRSVVLGKRHAGLKLLMYVRDESHRFCRLYHHLLRKKGYTPGSG